MTTRHTLDQLVRRQRSKLTAQLVSRCGYRLLPLIEDAIQDALLKALEKWEYDGLPENAEAWLYKAAYHRAIDLIRKQQPEVAYEEQDDTRVETDGIEDAELRLLLLCCHDSLSRIEQQLLMLNLVIGLDYAELATLTLSTKDAIAQRLARIKRKSRNTETDSATLDWHTDHINSVTTIIYAAFNVGYFPRRGEKLIRRDVALEARRLCIALAHQSPEKSGLRGQLFALAALMSFQCSRLDARQSKNGDMVLLDDQDPSEWDHQLISEGHELLIHAKRPNELSMFHLEAGIAALHTRSPEQTDWGLVTKLYQTLLEHFPTPGRIIGAAVAYAKLGELSVALELLQELESTRDFSDYGPLHFAKARVLSDMGRHHEARESLRSAQLSSSSAPILRFMEEQTI